MMILTLVHWGVLLTLIGWLLAQRHTSRLEALLHGGATALATGFFFWCGEWHAVGGLYLRYVVLVALVAAIGWVLSRSPAPSSRVPRLRLLRSGVLGLMAVLFGLGVVSALRARLVAEPVDLALPLREATYFATDGGASRVVNVHYRGGTFQDFAVDLTRLDRWGRQRRWGKRGLEAYPVFGSTVYSPCAGQVVEARDGIEDSVPPDFDASKGGGNYVKVDCLGVRVFLYHLKRGSVTVQPGEDVAAGAELGAVGNSGFSMAPHLHIHASRDPQGSGKTTEPVPITFGGRFLVRNTFVRN